MVHAKYSPSAGKQWIACPASWARNLPKEGEHSESSEAAKEGTIAHALSEFCLVGNISPKRLAGKKLTVEIDGVRCQHEITDEMAENVTSYYEHCQTLSMLADRRMVETQVNVGLDLDGNGEITDDILWGTADFIAVSTHSRRLDVVDLKYGNLKVDPVNNPQGAAYILGAIDSLRNNTSVPIETAAFHIVQPRISREPQVWEIEDVQGFERHWRDKFTLAIKACKAAADNLENPLHYSAGDHCRFCSVIPTCEAFASHMIDTASSELEEIESGNIQPARLDTLTKRYEGKKVVTHYYEQLEAYLSRQLRLGNEIKGYKLVKAFGNRKWKDEKTKMTPRFRAQGLKKAEFITEKLRTPAQLEKSIDNPDFFAKWTERPEIGEKLVPISDKREAINTIAQAKEELTLIEPVAPLETEAQMEDDFDLLAGLEETTETNETAETTETKDEDDFDLIL